MKPLLFWTILALVIMLGLPCLSVAFVLGSGFAVFLLLFFFIDPVFCAVCGVFAGIRMKKLRSVPLINACLFVLGAWLFFEMGEVDFLLYGGGYLLIGYAAMGFTVLIRRILKS